MIGRSAYLLSGALTALLVGLGLAWSAVAETAADGAWRLQLELSSFHHGRIASFDEVVEVRNGHFSGGFDQRRTQVVLSFAIAGEVLSGRVAVTPGSNWNTGTRSFRGTVTGGVFEGEIEVPATFELHGDEDGDLDSRLVAVRMRLARQ